MGLHDTPAGQFYVQHSLRTGEVLQILPVKRQEPPSALPSVGALGITETFIERRRVTLAADQARVSTPQDRLQQELARAGGERLLETGKAVLAGSAAAAATNTTTAGASTSTSTSSAATAQDTLPVCSWPESSLDNSRRPQQLPPVRLPSFREIDDAARHAAEQQQQQHSCRLPQLHQHQHQHQYLALPSDRKRPAAASAASPRGRRLRSGGRSGASSRESSLDTGRGRDGGRDGDGDGDGDTSYDHMAIDHHGGDDGDSDGRSFAATTPVPAALSSPARSPSSSSSSAASSPPMLSYSSSSSSSSSSSVSPPPSSHLLAPPLPQPQPQPAKKNKTVWIIRTLEPRRVDVDADDAAAYAPQRVQTHVETHMM